MRLPAGILFAGAGRADLIEAYISWENGLDGRPPPADRDDFEGLLLQPDFGGIHVISPITWAPVGPPLALMAIGPHTEFLLAAMLAGASAEQAIRLAIDHCDGAGGVVQVETL